MNLFSLSSTTSGRTALAVAERVLLGGVTFLVTILLGRWGGPAELGIFAIFFPLVFIAIAFQESLIIVPYMIYASTHPEGEARRQYLGSVLIHTAILNLAVAAAFGVGAAWFAFEASDAYAVASLMLAAAVPCVLLREFARRIVYAERRPDIAVVISGAVGAMQVAAMAGLYAAGYLTAASSFAAMGISSIAGGLAWLYWNRREIQLRGASVRDSFRLNWTLGGWSLGTQLSDIVSKHMFPWLLILATNEKTVGVFAACAVVASLPLPLHHALSNMLVPELVHTHRREGVRSARRLMLQATGLLSGVMVAYLLVVAVLSGHVLPWIYGAKFAGFAGTAQTLIVLAAAQVLNGAALPASRALLVFERPKQIFAAQVAGIVVNLALGVPLVAIWGIVGAAYATLAGATLRAGLIAWWYAEEARQSLHATADIQETALAGELISPAQCALQLAPSTSRRRHARAATPSIADSVPEGIS
jgi:O-antigen/teichoic acid export membrane protein